jgi:hypothetical protein
VNKEQALEFIQTVCNDLLARQQDRSAQAALQVIATQALQVLKQEPEVSDG